MDLGRISQPSTMSLFNPYRMDGDKNACSAPKKCQEPADLSAVAQRMSRYQVHIEEHRNLEVGLRLNVGTGKGVQVDMAAVAKAKVDPSFSDLKNLVQDFDALTEDQKNMIYAAGVFLKDKSPEGYQQLKDFVSKAKDHAAANPGKAFAMDFKFKSSESLVVDYYEETQESMMVSRRNGQEETNHYKQSMAASRKVVFSQTFQVSGILMGLGEVMGDIQAGLKPETALSPDSKDKTPDLPKPANATADLLDEILENLDEPLDIEVPEDREKKPHPQHPDHPVFIENPGWYQQNYEIGPPPRIEEANGKGKGKGIQSPELTELVVGYA